MQTETRTIYSISQLNRITKQLLEDAFTPLWVEGEISNLSQPSSGHLYFTLKDANAQVRCAMFRHKNQALNFRPENGLQVNAYCRVSLYEGRGDYQLIVEHLEQAGFGMLQRAYEELKKTLAKEGLFNEAHKKALPSLPQCIGVVTSPTGAAIRDILSVLKRRFAGIPVIIYPTAVQGTDAAPQIVSAIETANQRNECDVLLVSRGGGSIEDLWPFNEEIVARAIFESQIPIVSGVGHEIDFTIADFVADYRAPTPSAAAETVTPDKDELKQTFNQQLARLQQFMQHHLHRADQSIKNLSKRLRHPGDKLREQAQRLDHLEQQLKQNWLVQLMHKQKALQQLQQSITAHSPETLIEKNSNECKNLIKRLSLASQTLLKQKTQQLASISRALDGVSPLNTLSRGFSITSQNDNIIRDAKDVALGEKVSIQLHQGKLICTADSVE